jgi:Domain of unknown function (DUF4232)
MHTPPPSGRRSRRLAISTAAIALASISATLIATASGSAATGTTASTPRCATSQLVVWLDTQGNGAAGSITYDVEFTNLSGHRCTLFGYPGVSAVNLAGSQLGSAASRDRARAARRVTLRNGGTATALVRIVDAGNFPSSSCRPVTAAGLRIFPPNQTAAKVIPFPFGACSRSGPTYLFVRVVR